MKRPLGRGRHLADGERLAAILAEALAVGAGLGGRGGLQEAGALGFARLVPVRAQRRLAHIGQVEIGLQDPLDGGLAGGPGRRLLDDFDDLGGRALDQLGRIGGRCGQHGKRRGGGAGGKTEDDTTTGKQRHRSLLWKWLQTVES